MTPKSPAQKAITMARCLEAELRPLQQSGEEHAAAALQGFIHHASYDALVRLYDRVLDQAQH